MRGDLKAIYSLRRSDPLNPQGKQAKTLAPTSLKLAPPRSSAKLKHRPSPSLRPAAPVTRFVPRRGGLSQCRDRLALPSALLPPAVRKKVVTCY
jgi:hypothetical protein